MIAIYVLMGNHSTHNLYYSLVAKDFTRLLCRYQPHDFFTVERISFTAVQVLGAEQKFYSKRSDIILWSGGKSIGFTIYLLTPPK